MIKRKAICLMASMFLALASMSANEDFPWVVYYNNLATTADFAPYNPIIFDSDVHPAIKPLTKQGKEVLGYIDLAEAEEYRSWFTAVQQQGILIAENPNFPGSWTVDIRSPYWKNLVLNTIAPSIISQGFTGLFLDQLDVAIALEELDPVTYAGMKAAAIDLVKSIRKKYPQKRLMMNRGYEILGKLGNDIDYELSETLYTSYSFPNSQYYVRPPEEYEYGLAVLNAARKSFPQLVIFSLDYWNPNDPAMIETIYQTERSHCIRPYVSTILLDTIVPEPAP